jgi:hypothetical protein
MKSGYVFIGSTQNANIDNKHSIWLHFLSDAILK